MAQSFIACDREQSFLMPPDVREWLPEGHLAWFVLDAVAEMDLDAFYAAYREDGRSRPAYEPAMMVALLLYAYARGIRSSRAIERACEEDVAFRVIAAQQQARSRDDRAVRRAPRGGAGGPVRRGARRCARRRAGRGRGDRGRRHQGAGQRQPRRDTSITSRSRARSSRRPRRSTRPRTSSTARRAATSCRRSWRTAQGRRGVAARGQAAAGDRARRARPRPVPRAARSALKEAKRRLEEELWTELRANEAYEAYRARGRMKDGRRFGRAARSPTRRRRRRRARSTSPTRTRASSRGMRGWLQGYNAQAVTNEHQIVIAAEVDGRRARLRAPRTDARRRPTRARRPPASPTRPRSCSPTPATGISEQMERIVADGIQVLIPPDASRRKAPGRAGTAASTRSCAASSPPSAAASSTDNANTMIEPVFGQHQVQPRHRPLPPTRPSRRPHRMAPDHRHPQPPQAPPAPARRRHRLTGAERATRPAHPASVRASPGRGAGRKHRRGHLARHLRDSLTRTQQRGLASSSVTSTCRFEEFRCTPSPRR